MATNSRTRGLLSSAMPDDITRYTLDFLDTHDVLSVAACNTHLNSLVETEAMWRNRSIRTWNVHPHDKPHGMLWKEFYIQQHQNLFMPLVSLLESHRHAVVPFYKAQMAADAFLHPTDAVLNALQHSRKLKTQFQQKKEVVQSQLHCINRVAIMPLLFVSWMSLLLCEYFFPDFFVYPYFKVIHPTKEGWEVGTYIDLAVAVRAWPLYVYAIIATIASAHFAGEETVNEVVVWKMIENSFRNIIHECQFRYVMICVLMMLMVVADWGLEIFCCVISVFGCLIALRSAYQRVFLGNSSVRWSDIGMQLAFNMAWAYLHYSVDIIFILVDYVCTPIFHTLTFGFHRSVVYGSTINLFSASVLVLLLVEVLVNLEFTRRNEPSKFHWRRITAVTIRSLINSHVYIYVMLHVGAWHVLLLKVIEEIFTHITEVCLIAFRCENTCGCNKVRKHRRAVKTV